MREDVSVWLSCWLPLSLSGAGLAPALGLGARLGARPWPWLEMVALLVPLVVNLR